jgi:predicted ATPase/class 3 adenylate cyclase
MMLQPSGTVTLVFTDVEGATRLLQELGAAAYMDALNAHGHAVRGAFGRHGGFEVDNQGDSFFFAFASARAALDAVAEALAALEGGPMRVRVGVHTGEPSVDPPKYVGVDVHRAARIMSAAHGGQVVISQSTHDLVAGEVEVRDLGEHPLKDFPDRQRLWQAGGGDFPPLRTHRQTQLPPTAWPLLGREREVADLVALMSNGARVVTITGPGGTGKTRLAIDVAHELEDRMTDGVFWVPLAGLRQADLVLPAIAQAVAPTEGLAEHLRERQAVLALDNFEHVLDARRALSELLAQAPQLKVLTTSRAALRIAGEHVYPLEPLELKSAVTMFVERAAAAGRHLEADGTVAEICLRLDCLPLALELAAARARLLEPESMLGRLERSLAVLTRGSADAPERQQTLRATIEWSHDLLQEEARVLLRRLSVFAGSFSLEAAEQAAGGDLDELEELVDLSLLKARDGGRFLMLETIREFAAERLAENGEEAALKRAHAEFVVELAEAAEPHLRGSGQERWLRAIDDDYDNVRAALGWARDTGEREVAGRICAALGRYWRVRPLTAEGRAWIAASLAAVDELEPATAARLVRAAAHLAALAGDYEEQRVLAEDALARWQAIGDQPAIAAALGDLAVAAMFGGDLDRAAEYYERSRAAARAGEDDPVLALVTLNLADLQIIRGDYARARELAEESAALSRGLGIGDVAAMSLLNLGLATFFHGETETALAAMREAAAAARTLGGDIVSQVFEAQAAARLRLGDPESGALLLGAADALRGVSGSAEQPFYAAMNGETREGIRAALGEGAEAAFARGRALELEEALELATG